MTDLELFDKLKRDGECWHDYKWVNRNGVAWLCKCGHMACFPVNFLYNPDFDTWKGFGWMKERVIEKGYYEALMEHLQAKIGLPKKARNDRVIPVYFIHPTRFKEAVKEYLE